MNLVLGISSTHPMIHWIALTISNFKSTINVINAKSLLQPVIEIGM